MFAYIQGDQKANISDNISEIVQDTLCLLYIIEFYSLDSLSRAALSKGLYICIDERRYGW